MPPKRGRPRKSDAQRKSPQSVSEFPGLFCVCSWLTKSLTKLFHLQGDGEDALRKLIVDKENEAQSGNTDTQFLLANACEALGRVDESRMWLMRAAEANPIAMCRY
jgi:hypothetical protein